FHPLPLALPYRLLGAEKALSERFFELTSVILAGEDLTEDGDSLRPSRDGHVHEGTPSSLHDAIE
ncbi:hypothetical protein B5M09_014013, partial [Aphanomyces astaci]